MKFIKDLFTYYKDGVVKIAKKLNPKNFKRAKFEEEPPISVVAFYKKFSLLAYFTFVLAILSTILFILSLNGITSVYFPPFLIVITILIGLSFLIFRGMIVHNYNQDKLEIVNAVVNKKRLNHITRQRWIEIVTEAGVEREIPVTKKQRFKKGALYELCVIKPTEERKEMLVSSVFLKYPEGTTETNEEVEEIIETKE